MLLLPTNTYCFDLSFNLVSLVFVNAQKFHAVYFMDFICLVYCVTSFHCYSLNFLPICIGFGEFAEKCIWQVSANLPNGDFAAHHFSFVMLC